MKKLKILLTLLLAAVLLGTFTVASAEAPALTDGLHEVGGEWQLYLGGEFAGSYTGLYSDAAIGWWLIKDGKVAFGYTGLYNDTNCGWWLIDNARVNFEFSGIWEEPGLGFWTISSGQLIGPAEQAPVITDGLHDDGGAWHLYQGGTVAAGFTGLYGDLNVGWWLVRDGAIDFGFTGLYNDANFGWWLVQSGAVAFDFTGTWNDTVYGPWAISKGQLIGPAEQAQGIPDGLHFDSDSIWRLYLNGEFASGYTGLYGDAEVGWWLVDHGLINFDYTGLYNDAKYGWWLVNCGQIAFDYTGLYNDMEVGWWLIGGGRLASDYTGYWNEVGKGQFYIENGYPVNGGPETPVVGQDFGGQTVYVYDWWSRDDENHSYRRADADETTQKQYAYQDQVEAANNVKVVTTSLYEEDGWAKNPERVAEMANSGETDDLNLIVIDQGAAGNLVSKGLLEPWDIDLSGEQWLDSVNDFMTVKGKIYGVNANGSEEPREVIFFNKAVLAEAGIDWNEIYDLAQNGQWTWEKFEEYMNKVARDTNNDGMNDVWALTGNGDRLTRGCVFGNNGTFFDTDEEGNLVITADSAQTLRGISQRQAWDSYMPEAEKVVAPGEEGIAWNWFEDFWKQGTTAFYVGQSYEGANSGSLMDSCDFEWGMVPFPKGPDAEDYLYAASDNVVVIPANCYEEETTQKLENLYAAYTAPTPGVDQETEWIGDKYERMDERTVDETLANLRQSQHAVANKALLLGSENAILGEPLFWRLDKGSAAQLVNDAKEIWQLRCDVFNGLKTEAELEAALEAKAALEAMDAEE